MGWRDKPYECPMCGWQGMRAAANEVACPECGTPMLQRTWIDTWGVTLLILGSVVAVVLFVVYVGR